MSKYTTEEMMEMSGERNLVRTSYPFLTFSEGKFYKPPKDPEGEPVALGDELRLVILRVRTSLYAFPSDEQKAKGEKWVAYSNERNSQFDSFRLTIKDEKGQKEIVSGTMQELKESFPTLKMEQVLYCLLQSSKIVRLRVRGKSFSNLIGYYQKFDKKKDEHIWQFATEITAGQDTYNDRKYWMMVFNKSDEVKDLDLIGDSMKEVAGAFSGSGNVSKPATQKQTLEEMKKDIPIVNEEDEDAGEDDEIDVAKDLPF